MMQDSILTNEQQQSVNASFMRLQEALEIPLRICVYRDCWDELSPRSLKVVEAGLETGPRYLSILPVPSSGSPEPFLIPNADGSHILGIPLETTIHAVIFAVGESTTGMETLLRAVSFQSRQIQEIRDEHASDVSRIDSFADQVLHDFEERNWLIQLTDHLAMCEVNRGLGDVVSSLLPRLQAIINAESVVFLPESAGSVIKLMTLSPFVCSGTPFYESQLCDIVQRFRRKALTQPLIMNWYREFECGERIPGVSSLMMIAVHRDSLLVGWLIAVNKLVDTGTAFRMPMTSDDSEFSDVGFGTAEAGLLRSAASVLATHQHNLSLFRANQNLTVSAVRSLANAVDARHSYTHGHSDRVARMARHLAMCCGESKTYCDQLMMTGLLHDIGKISVPDRVLLKPDRLNDEEFFLIKQHPRTGYQILQHIAELSYALDGVLHHHEAWNGAGYPGGLKEEQIPLSGRLLAVVDTYDAMTSNRPYRNGMSFEKAESILLDGAGVQWDPVLIAVFLRHKEEFRSICRDSPDHSLSTYHSGYDSITNLGSESLLDFTASEIVPEFTVATP